jgi:transposase-like protein
MSSILTDVVETGGDARHAWPAERRPAVGAGYRASGHTMSAFARRERINDATSAGWVAKASRELGAHPPLKFAELALPFALPAEVLEVRLADGTVLRGGRVADVVALVRALRVGHARVSAGHPDLLGRAARVHAQVVSCQRHGKAPFAYLSVVLARLPPLTNREDLTPLTPAGRFLGLILPSGSERIRCGSVWPRGRLVLGPIFPPERGHDGLKPESALTVCRRLSVPFSAPPSGAYIAAKTPSPGSQLRLRR